MKWSRPISWDRPRVLNKKLRCALLDGDGRQCLSPAVKADTVHGNGEYDPAWYAVPFCERHADDTTRYRDYNASPMFHPKQAAPKRKKRRSDVQR